MLLKCCLVTLLINWIYAIFVTEIGTLLVGVQGDSDYVTVNDNIDNNSNNIT